MKKNARRTKFPGKKFQKFSKKVGPIANQEPNNSIDLVFWADGDWSCWNEFDLP